jgi:hypothetical protein
MKFLTPTVLAAAAVLVAFQNPASAVFEKVLIDDFSNPTAATHSGTPGSPDPWSTRASGGMSGTVYNLSSGMNPGTDIALDRGLSANPGAAMPTAMVAGSGMLSATFTATGQMTGLDWNVNGYDFANLSIVLSGLTNNLPFNTLLGITLFQDGVAVDSTTVSFTGLQSQDVFLTPTSGATDFLGLQFENLTSTGFAVYSLDEVAATPEPATMALIGIGVLGGAIGYRRRRSEDDVRVETDVS